MKNSEIYVSKVMKTGYDVVKQGDFIFLYHHREEWRSLREKVVLEHTYNMSTDINGYQFRTIIEEVWEARLKEKLEGVCDE